MRTFLAEVQGVAVVEAYLEGALVFADHAAGTEDGVAQAFSVPEHACGVGWGYFRAVQGDALPFGVTQTHGRDRSRQFDGGVRIVVALIKQAPEFVGQIEAELLDEPAGALIALQVGLGTHRSAKQV